MDGRDSISNAGARGLSREANENGDERMNQHELSPPGQIILLHGAPRYGKTSILNGIQSTFDGSWMNLGFDTFIFSVRPSGYYRPESSLYPLGPHRWIDDGADDKRHVLGPHSAPLMSAMYDSIAAHSRWGFNVVADVVHPDISHREIVRDAVNRLSGLPVLFVGLRCPLEVAVARRNASADGIRASGSGDDPVPPIARWWDREIHVAKVYDVEVDTSSMSPEECVEAIRKRLVDGPSPTAFQRLAGA